MHLNIFVSQKCFVYCNGCYSISRTEKCNNCVSSDIIISFLKYAYDNGIDRVTLCGGDPLTRSDIIELIKEIKKIGLKISLDTVGTNIIKDVRMNNSIYKKINPKFLAKYVDCIGIPIDGSSNQVIKSFRNVDSNFLNNQIKICEELNKYGANICINTVAHKENLDDVIGLCDLIKRINIINKWQIFQYAPVGIFGFLNRKRYEITDSQFNSYKENILKNFNDYNKIQFKSCKNRDKKYMMIDNEGNAWIQNFDSININDSYNVESRSIVGNINNEKDWFKICNFINNEM